MVHLDLLGVIMMGSFRESFSDTFGAWGLDISLYYFNTHKRMGLWNITTILQLLGCAGCWQGCQGQVGLKFFLIFQQGSVFYPIDWSFNPTLLFLSSFRIVSAWVWRYWQDKWEMLMSPRRYNSSSRSSQPQPVFCGMLLQSLFRIDQHKGTMILLKPRVVEWVVVYSLMCSLGRKCH